MLAGLLLALIGVADIVRARAGTTTRGGATSRASAGPGRAGRSGNAGRSRNAERVGRNRESAIAIAVVWIGLGAVAWFGLGIEPWIVLGVAAAAGLWVASTTAVGSGVVASTTGRPAAREASGSVSRRDPARWSLRRSGSWPSILLALVIAVLFVAGPGSAASATGFVVDWHRDSGLSFIDALPLAALVGGVGSALFLIDSANIVVTSALPSGVAVDPVAVSVVPVIDDQADGAPGAPGEVEQREAAGEPAPGDEEAAEVPESQTRELKGGRLIGPIERLLLAGFALTGAFPVVAALIAAKGIVRFPEINRATTGNPAEYFLIGSLVSWATAFSLAGLCWLLALA